VVQLRKSPLLFAIRFLTKKTSEEDFHFKSQRLNSTDTSAAGKGKSTQWLSMGARREQETFINPNDRDGCTMSRHLSG
jgi:hypothetical protein